MDHTDNEVLARALKKALTPDQIHAVLEAITAEITNGYCPLCEHEEIPVDERGRDLNVGDDVSNAEWEERHYSNCLVSLLEKAEVTAQ